MNDVELLGRKQRREAKMAKKVKNSVKGRPLRGPVSFAFSIDVYTPDTIPMSRLGEYMTELAKMLGEESSVHFEKVTSGSTNLHHVVAYEATPKVVETVNALRRGMGSPEARKRYKNIDRMLMADNAVASYSQEGKSATVLKFPGRENVVPQSIVTRQRGTIQGTVTRVGGTDETAHVQIVNGKQKIGGCVTTRTIAQALGMLLYRDVRLHGVGKWMRDEEGVWSIEEFRIEAFDALQGDDLESALTALREIKIDWPQDAMEQLKAASGSN
jgi:hypothetical protein